MSADTTNPEETACTKYTHDGCLVNELDRIDLSHLEFDDNDDWYVLPAHQFVFFFNHLVFPGTNYAFALYKFLIDFFYLCLLKDTNLLKNYLFYLKLNTLMRNKL